MSDINHEFQIPNTVHNPGSQTVIASDIDMFAKLDAQESNETKSPEYISELFSQDREIIKARENKIQTGELINEESIISKISKVVFNDFEK